MIVPYHKGILPSQIDQSHVLGLISSQLFHVSAPEAIIREHLVFFIFSKRELMVEEVCIHS